MYVYVGYNVRIRWVLMYVYVGIMYVYVGC